MHEVGPAAAAHHHPGRYGRVDAAGQQHHRAPARARRQPAERLFLQREGQHAFAQHEHVDHQIRVDHAAGQSGVLVDGGADHGADLEAVEPESTIAAPRVDAEIAGVARVLVRQLAGRPAQAGQPRPARRFPVGFQFPIQLHPRQLDGRRYPLQPEDAVQTRGRLGGLRLVMQAHQQAAFDVVDGHAAQAAQHRLHVVQELAQEHLPVSPFQGDLGVGAGDDGRGEGHDSPGCCRGGGGRAGAVETGRSLGNVPVAGRRASQAAGGAIRVFARRPPAA